MELIVHNPQDEIHTRREQQNATLGNENSLLGFYTQSWRSRNSDAGIWQRSNWPGAGEKEQIATDSGRP